MAKSANGYDFPLYGEQLLSWSPGAHFTLADQQEGYPRTLTVLRAMKEHRPEQLEQERREMVKGSFDRMFGHNAKQMLLLIEQVLQEGQ